MTLEARPASAEAIGTLQCCLVEADPASEKRARLIKRRALVVSIAFQSVVVVALILYPLLGKSERISLKNMTPIPPYAPVGRPHETTVQHHSSEPAPCRFCPPTIIPHTIVEHTTATSNRGDDNDDNVVGIVGTPTGDAVVGSNLAPTSRPVDPTPHDPPYKKTPMHVSELVQMAQLVNRVDPIYPALAKQTHLEGRVELHAIISTDGRIQSLTVVSGHPLFIQSALAAVREWRYRPTILNGSPIEVETSITVIYTLGH